MVPTSASSNEDHYFSLDDLERGFSLIVADDLARTFARIWADVFAEFVVGDKVVAMPESFGVRRLRGQPAREVQSGSPIHPDELESLHGRRLIRFTPGTLTLIAAANTEARRRLDRLNIKYGSATIDDPTAWRQLLEFLQQP